MSNKIEFSRGPHGEIIPPPLFTLSGVTPDDLDGVVAEMVGDIYDHLPDPSLYHEEALVYLHQQNLLRLLAGEFEESPEAVALREAVLRGELLSLRPFGREEATYRYFAPVLRRTGDDRWRLGLADYGRRTVLFSAADAPSALERARHIYVIWAELEEADQ